MAHSPFQIIYLSLHGLTIVLSPGYATTHLGMALARLGGMHTPPLNSFHYPNFAQSQEDYSAAEALWVLSVGDLFGMGFLGVDLILPCLIVALINTQVLSHRRRQLQGQDLESKPKRMEPWSNKLNTMNFVEYGSKN